MKVYILTIFPDYFSSPLSLGLLKIAQEKKLLKVELHNLRDYTPLPHRQVDDQPYGGGPGMVMRPEPFFRALFSILKVRTPREVKKKAAVVFLSPSGEVFNQELAAELARKKRLVFLCGRYEGIDDRVRELASYEISVGDYVLAGGEVAALVILEAVARLIPGVVGSGDSLVEESFSFSLLEYPQYTRPREYLGLKVPEVLLSGNHKEIEKWRREKALEKTFKKRPDLLEKAVLGEEETAFLKKLQEKAGKED